MKTLLLLLISFLLLTSCSTIFLRREYKFPIKTDAKNAQVKAYDSTYSLPANLKVKRSKKDLDLLLINDSTQKPFRILSRSSPHFIFGNLLWSYAIPIAYAVDLTNQKRFYYGNEVFLSFHDTSEIIDPAVGKKIVSCLTNPKKTSHSRKGEFYFHFALPSFAHVYKIPDEEPWYYGGVQFPTMGWEYNFSDDRFLDFTFGNIATNLHLYETFDSGDEPLESGTTVFFDLTVNKRSTRFTYGAGINYSWDRYTWNKFHYDTLTLIDYNWFNYTNRHSVALILNGYYQLGKYSYLGLVYRPSFLITYPVMELRYTHSISLELRWRFPMQKRSNDRNDRNARHEIL